VFCLRLHLHLVYFCHLPDKMDRSFTFPNASGMYTPISAFTDLELTCTLDNAEDTRRRGQQSSRGSRPAADSATPSNTTASASNPRRRAILGSGNWRQTAAPPAGSPTLGPRTESTNLRFAAVTPACGKFRFCFHFSHDVSC
jgi:hypothetical protein